MKNCVKIILKKDDVYLYISEKAEHIEVIECLKEKLPELKKFYKGEKIPITITGKVLKNKEIEDVKEIIKKDLSVKLKFDTPRDLGLHGIKRVFSKDLSESETKYHRGSLRSGQKMEFEGSIVIIGDVNAGAEVMAGENIIVLGEIRGLTHAGAKGNKDAIISAASINTSQIRISNIVKEMERGEDVYQYAYASINDKDEIIIE